METTGIIIDDSMQLGEAESRPSSVELHFDVELTMQMYRYLKANKNRYIKEWNKLHPSIQRKILAENGWSLDNLKQILELL